MIERFRNGSESGCDEASSGAILCHDHGNCCGCGWRCDCGSCSGCHGFGSVIFRNLGCGDRLISHECKQSLPGRHKRTWHWKDNIPSYGGKTIDGNEGQECFRHVAFPEVLTLPLQRNIIHDKRSNQYTYLMWAEFGVVQLSNGIGHVFFAHKFYNSGSISEDIGVAHVARFAHVVLQVLPAAALRESWSTEPKFPVLFMCNIWQSYTNKVSPNCGCWIKWYRNISIHFIDQL